ncbi:MAG: hypothetical protein ACRDL8_08215, partial [Solirubrobacteraceae bacterium]
FMAEQQLHQLPARCPRCHGRRLVPDPAVPGAWIRCSSCNEPKGPASRAIPTCNDLPVAA